MKKGFKKAAAAGLTAIMLLSSVNFSGFTVNAALPTTDGHDKYVNKAAFDVIGSKDFGSKDLDGPLFDKTKGSQNITELQVPTLAYDDTSVGLVWQKPEKYDNVADYKIWINNTYAGTARENFKVNAEWTAKYMEAFYDYYDKNGDVDMTKVDIHSYRATGLSPDTEYTFKVVAVDAAGNELGTAQTIKQRTAKTPETVNILDYGAKTSEGYVTYNDEINAFIEANTKAIQAAIDACPEGGRVVIPEGTFVSGALWLKSNMTLEINGTLWASPNSDHFEIGFLMYPFYTDTRVWGLVNATSADENAPLKNIRITGTGTLYGNGWKYGEGNTIKGDGFGRYTYSESADVDTSAPGNEKYTLPRWVAGNNTKVYNFGVQAADTCTKWLKNCTNPDGSRKYSDELVDSLADRIAKNNGDKLSEIETQDLKNAYAARASLLIMKNVTNVYVGDITVENPSNHSVNILDSRNISATNVKVFSYDGNNGDGLGFGCSQNVICWNNFTDTGDDNLGFGASVGEGARDSEIQTNSELWMFNNYLHEGHGGLAAGSHTGNGIQDVLFEDTVMNHIDAAFRFKSAPTNGGFIANITMRDCAVAGCDQGFVLTTSYSDPNSASSTEAAEVAEFYNFAAVNISVYEVKYNTIQVLADVDTVNNPQKPWHTHHNLYFQDVTFGNVGTNGSYKNKNGWETLIGCENAVFYNVKTNSYSSKAVSKGTDKAWNNLQYCKNIRFQGTTMDSLNADKEKMQNIMSGITVTDKTVKAENYVPPVGDYTVGATIKSWSAKDIAATKSNKSGTVGTADEGLAANCDYGNTWKTGSDGAASWEGENAGTTYACQSGGNKAMDADGVTQSKGTIPVSGAYLTYEATQDGVLSVAEKTLATKRFYIVDSDGKVCAEHYNANPKGGATEYKILTTPVTKGKTYYIYANGATNNIFKVWLSEKIDGAEKPQAKDGKNVKITWNAVDNGTEKVFYGVDVYAGGQKVDARDGIKDTSVIIDRLSSGVDYTFKVYVSENGDSANSMNLTGWNKTYIGETSFKTDGEKDTEAIKAPADSTVSAASTVYTHTQGSWESLSRQDKRVRGYDVYVNGKLTKTIYNYQIPKYETADTVSKQIGRMKAGIDNEIKIVAFTDAGVEYAYTPVTVKTLENYDYKAPVFAETAKVTATKQANGDVVLTWNAAVDDTAVNGYRVYVDGKPVYANAEDVFNPVNADKTTDKTTYTISGLDLTKDHTFTIQAGDTWWKAAQTMGSYDKMAYYNWTVKGISTELKTAPPVVEKADYTAVDNAIKAANALVPGDYVDFTGVTNAINAVVRDLPKSDQAKVDAMAQAILDAIGALEKKPEATEPDTEPDTENDAGADDTKPDIKPDDGNTPAAPGDTPKTGDSTSILMVMMTFIISGGLLVIIWDRRKKKYKFDK